MPRPPRRGERGPTRPSPQPGPRGGGAAFSSSPLPPCPQPPLPAFPSRSFPVALLSWSLSPLPGSLSSCLPRWGLPLSLQPPLPHSPPWVLSPGPREPGLHHCFPRPPHSSLYSSFLLLSGALWTVSTNLSVPVPTSHSPLALVHPFSSPSLALGKPPLLSEKSRVVGATPLGIGSSGRKEWPGSPGTQTVSRKAGSFPPCGSSWLIVCL